MKAFITKHSLTVGIVETDEAEPCGDTMIRVGLSGAFTTRYYHANEWWESKKSAIARAEEMRNRKIVSLEKQLERLKGLVFE